MVLTSAAASTQTTILPTARTTLSMAVYRALPEPFARVHPRYLTPSFSTLLFGGIAIVLYASMNYLGTSGSIIADAVTALGMLIAFYYGLTGFACAWYYRKNLRSSSRNLWMQGILPTLGGADPVFRSGLEPARRLALAGRGQLGQLHPLEHTLPAILDRRRCLPYRRRVIRRWRHPHVHLAGNRTGLLP
jgi:hypothetical protein